MLFFVLFYVKILNKKRKAGYIEMADLSKSLYKIQLALKQKGIKVYINTSQFYSDEQDRYIKMYTILDSKRKLIINTASQIKAMKALNEIWLEVKNNE